MTALQWIVKEAKTQKKKYPTKFKTWKEYIKQASKQYNIGIKPSFPIKKVGKIKKKTVKKIVRKKVAKKIGKIDPNKAFKKQMQVNKIINTKYKDWEYPVPPVYTGNWSVIAWSDWIKKNGRKIGAIKRKTAKKKKPSEQSILNRIHKVKDTVNKLDEAQHKHMIGGKKHFTHSLLDELNSTLNKINNAQIYKDRYESALKYKKVPKDKIQIYKNEIKKIKEYIKELRTHFTQIKKNYKPI